eukprot:RCo052881
MTTAHCRSWVVVPHSLWLAVLLSLLCLSVPAEAQSSYYAFFPWVTQSASLQFSQALGAGAVLNNKIYVFGGFSAGSPISLAEMFDPAEQKLWPSSFVSIASMPTASYGHTAITMDNVIYMLGGSLPQVLLYDETNGYSWLNYQWTTTSYWSSVVWNNTILLTGGQMITSGTRTTYASDQIVLFDPYSGFRQLSIRLSRSRYFHGSVVIGTVLYVVGGLYTTYFGTTLVTTCLSSMETIDLLEGTVSIVDLRSEGLTPRCDPGITLLPNNLIAVVGGTTSVTDGIAPTPESSVQLIGVGYGGTAAVT